MLYMVTFTTNIPPMLVYIPYMDPMGYGRTTIFPWFLEPPRSFRFFFPVTEILQMDLREVTCPESQNVLRFSHGKFQQDLPGQHNNGNHRKMVI